MADKTAAAISKSLKRQSRGVTAGRGGAGNWNWEDEETKKAAEEEKKLKGEELEQKAKDVVDQGLKLPEKVHHHIHPQHKHDEA